MGAGWFKKLFSKVKKFAGDVWGGFKKGIGAIAPILKKGVDAVAPLLGPVYGGALKTSSGIVDGMDKVINRK
jgi:hypothetical protein